LWPAGEQAKHSIQLTESEVIILNQKSEENKNIQYAGPEKTILLNGKMYFAQSLTM